MDHEEALEQLELAAVEPDGFERLMAGDTPTAASVAAHVAGCASCAAELERLRRATPLLRDVVRTTPSPELRERTLAFVREHGVPRGDAVAGAASSGAVPVVAVVPPADSIGRREARRESFARRTLPWVAAIAATAVISVAATTAWLGRDDDRYASQDRAIAGLGQVASATLEITGEPGSQRVVLASTDGSDATGSLLFSPTTTELVVVANGLGKPPAGQEYRCWFLVDGQRQDVGKMFFADDLAYWVGDTPSVASVPAGTTFGVSLTDLGGSGAPADPVLSGTL